MGHQPIGFAAQKTISGKYIEREIDISQVLNFRSSTKKIESFKIEKKDGHFAIPDKAKRYDIKECATNGVY